MKTIFKKNGGFTLVELIVVIAILAILAAVAIPAYSGYIEKANRAGDEQLLAAVNKAFASACVMNGDDIYLVKNVQGIELMDGKIPNAEAVAPYGNEFWEFYKDNKDTAFKTIEELYFDPVTCQFKDGKITVTYRGQELQVSAKDMALLANSNLGGLGASVLLSEMDSAINSAGPVLGDMAGDSFNKAFNAYLGLGENATDADRKAAAKALSEKTGIPVASIRDNAIALYAAQNSEGVTQEKINTWLAPGGVDAMMQSPSGSTLAEGAAIYGLYMSYKGKDFAGVSDTKTAIAVLQDATTDAAFIEWTKGEKGQSELEAYLAAMNTINSATENKDATSSILASGFNDKELVDTMTGLIGK